VFHQSLQATQPANAPLVRLFGISRDIAAIDACPGTETGLVQSSKFAMSPFFFPRNGRGNSVCQHMLDSGQIICKLAVTTRDRRASARLLYFHGRWRVIAAFIYPRLISQRYLT
jgi:hypothetical protein